MSRRRTATVDLVLYVAPQSPASMRAQRNLEALLHEYDETRVTPGRPRRRRPTPITPKPTAWSSPRPSSSASAAPSPAWWATWWTATAVTNVLTMGGLEKKE